MPVVVLCLDRGMVGFMEHKRRQLLFPIAYLFLTSCSMCSTDFPIHIGGMVQTGPLPRGVAYTKSSRV